MASKQLSIPSGVRPARNAGRDPVRPAQRQKVPAAGNRASKSLSLETESSEFIGGKGFAGMRKKKHVPSRAERAEAMFGSMGKGLDDMFADELERF